MHHIELNSNIPPPVTETYASPIKSKSIVSTLPLTVITSPSYLPTAATAFSSNSFRSSEALTSYRLEGTAGAGLTVGTATGAGGPDVSGFVMTT